MRIIWLVFIGLALAIAGLLPRLRPAGRATAPARPASAVPPGPAAVSPGRTDSVVAFAVRQLGTPYLYAGTSPATGFDCSGFVQYVYGHFGVAVPHSTALLIDAGRPVPRADARPGDLVVFTGTAPGATTPGHAGIVVAAGPGGPIRFVHASSARRESGVKVSQVEGTGYEQRFMQVRRVLGPGTGAAAPAPAAHAGPRAAAAVAALPTRPVAAAPATAPAVLPKLLLTNKKQKKLAHVVTRKKAGPAPKTKAPRPTAKRKPAALAPRKPAARGPRRARAAR